MGLLGRDVLGRRVEIKTPRTHYKGEVVGYMFDTRNYQVKITQVIKGSIATGRIITAKTEHVLEDK